MTKILRFLWVVLGISVYAQTWPADTIRVQINSGNPKFPFPQFLEYQQGKTLARYNAEGVTHADMEKAMREAYQIMMHRSLWVPGKTLNGVRYIVYNHPSVPKNNGTFVSEGDGYALLAAAYFADKPTFDGLWLWIHDNRLSGVRKYWDCSNLRPTYRYGKGLPGWKNDETTGVGNGDNDSATDGDYDIAMGLLMAYRQWGNLMGINDACGAPISYRDEALKMIKALVDTVRIEPLGSPGTLSGYISGDVGIDGYTKNGNTWGELTDWRYNAANQLFPNSHLKPEVYSMNPLMMYTDYIGPSYFKQFADFLAANGGTPWQISQFRRGEASADWLMGQMFAKGYIASSGRCTVSDDGSVTTFGQHPIEPGGEDFRAAWRTILNYVWHGNPTTSWNPVTHQVVNTPNTYERDIALQHAAFLKEPGNPKICAKFGTSPDPASPNFRGVAHLKQGLSVTGTTTANYNTNFNVGTGAAAAVASEDLDLIAEVYRQAEILWDDQSAKSNGLSDYERYIGSTPVYFHDWFRVLGMLTTSGNLHPPSHMNAGTNLKVYMAVNKTYAYTGDQVGYTVSYRNYGTLNASNAVIRTPLDADYEFVSASNGGIYNAGTHTIQWTIASVPGFTSAGGAAASSGNVNFTVRVRQNPPNARVCLQSTISLSNVVQWTSNEYPNNASYTMERNCVDILGENRNLTIQKTASRQQMNPGDVVTFKVKFENKSIPNSWLNGGRDRVVVSYGNYLFNYTFYQFYRFWHAAPEAYVNMNNYRISYYMNDPAAAPLPCVSTPPTGWDSRIDNQNDLDKYGYNPASGPITFSYQAIPPGSDANGSWNQRIMTRFANVLTAPSTHIFDKLDNLYLIHKGVWGPAFIRTKLESVPSSILTTRVADDWSYSASVDVGQIASQNARFSPVTNGWANVATPNVVINNYTKDVCDAPVTGFSKVLVEEFDGYTWRRIAGNGPLPGKEAYQVLVTDTIPLELAWDGFIDNTGICANATYTPAPTGASYTGVVRLLMPVMLTGEKDSLIYKVIAKDPPCPAPDKAFDNVAWISSQTDSPDSSRVPLLITCNPLPPPPLVETSLRKTANVASTQAGGNVRYTLTFTNKDGSTGQWNGTSTLAAHWQSAGSGLLPRMNGSILSLDQNASGNPNPGAIGYAFYHTKVHGVNGWMESTLTPSNASNVSYFFRHTAGTPGQADFQGVRLEITPNPMGANTMVLRVYNNAALLANLTGISYGGSSNPIQFRVELVDNTMCIYVNNLSGVPLKTVTGITNLNPGYAGIYGNNSQQTLTAWKAHFDSAFDVVLSDVLPAEVSNPSAITNAGVYNAGTRTITWPARSGPILANAVLKDSFLVQVDACAAFIVNNGYASTFGVANIQAQHVLGCSVSLPVQLNQWDAKRQQQHVQLQWLANEDHDCKHYQVLRKRDNLAAELIHTHSCLAPGQPSAYTFVDENQTASAYYALKQVDQDGQHFLSEWKWVAAMAEAQGTVMVFPNPFDQEAWIQNAGEETVQIALLEPTGKLLWQASLPGGQTLSLPATLSAGVYVVEIISKAGRRYERISKQP
ncbi:MAG: glycosyl hydrolase family 8 [Cytophagaceae bacterium]|jgi:uncharacterized repeat protein (TIGR01451 family)|nr:glycosyl hydrolase family 8 [Cytophagaceae bacterium]